MTPTAGRTGFDDQGLEIEVHEMARATRLARLGGAVSAVRTADMRFSWGQRIAALPAALSAALVGRLGGGTRLRALAALLGLAYVASPIDLIPEVLVPLVGFADDAIVGAWAATTLVQLADEHLGGQLTRVTVTRDDAPAAPRAALH